MRHLVRPSFGISGGLAWDAGNLPDPPNYLWAAVADVTAATASSDVSVLGSGATSALTLPANWLVVGRTLRLRGFLRYTTPSTAGVLTLKLKLGSTTIATFTTSGLLASASNAGGTFDLQLTCRSAGSSGTVIAGGRLEMATSTNGGANTFFAVNSAAVTVNTTAALLLDLTGSWSAASNSLTVVTAEVSAQ